MKHYVLLAFMVQLLLAGCQQEVPTEAIYHCANGQVADALEPCSEQACDDGPSWPKQRALVVTTPGGIYQSGVDEDGVIIAFYVVNYGYAAAKNVNVTCRLFDLGFYGIGETVILEKTARVGNVGSTSYSYEEIYAKPAGGLDLKKPYGSLCFPSGCDDCELLFERIPEYVEAYK